MTDPNMEINQEKVLVHYLGRDESAVVPEGVVRIGSGAFRGNGSVREVVLPDSVTSIEEGAFRGCGALKSIRLPSGLNEMGEGAFCDCAIAELQIPEGMTYIPRKSFCSMRLLEKVSLPSALKTIGPAAFSECVSLREIRIPEGTLKIERDAFYACTNLEKVEFPKSLVSMDRVVFAKTRLKGSEELARVYQRVNQVKRHLKPLGWREISFDGLDFYYGFEKTYRGDCAPELPIDAFVHDHDVAGSQSICRTADGRKALLIQVDVPTFDYGDRESDSYRKLFLMPAKRGAMGILIAGGYRIARITVYNKLIWANDRTEKLMRGTGIFV